MQVLRSRQPSSPKATVPLLRPYDAETSGPFLVGTPKAPPRGYAEASTARWLEAPQRGAEATQSGPVGKAAPAAADGSRAPLTDARADGGALGGGGTFGASALGSLGMEGCLGRTLREAQLPLKAGLLTPPDMKPPAPTASQDHPPKQVPPPKSVVTKPPPVQVLVKGASVQDGSHGLLASASGPSLAVGGGPGAAAGSAVAASSEAGGQVNGMLSMLTRGIREAPMMPKGKEPPTLPKAGKPPPTPEEAAAAASPPPKAPPPVAAAFGAIGSVRAPEAKAPPEVAKVAKAPDFKLPVQVGVKEAVPPAKAAPAVGEQGGRAQPEVRAAPARPKDPPPAAAATSYAAFGSSGFGGLTAAAAGRGEFGRPLDEAGPGQGLSQIWQPQILQKIETRDPGQSRDGSGVGAVGSAVGSASLDGDEPPSPGRSSDDSDCAVGRGQGFSKPGHLRELGLDPSVPEWFPPGTLDAKVAPVVQLAGALKGAPGLSLAPGLALAPAAKATPQRTPEQSPEPGAGRSPPPDFLPPSPPLQDSVSLSKAKSTPELDLFSRLCDVNLDLAVDHPKEVLKNEIRRQGKAIADLQVENERLKADLSMYRTR